MDESQAPTVRLIRKLFIDGHSISNISQELTRRELKTVKGDQLDPLDPVQREIQRRPAVAKQLHHRLPDQTSCQNTSEIPQYYVKGNHEPIIDPDIFD